MEKFLKKLYKKYLDFERKYYFGDAKFFFGVEKLKLNKKILKKFYENYERTPFLEFLQDIKYIIYSKNVFDFAIEKAKEEWDLWYYLKFLEKEKIIRIKRTGSISLIKIELKKIFPRPKTEKQIKEKIEKKLKIKVKQTQPVINLFKKFTEFRVKAKWDQLPISVDSAIFVVKKILDHLPLNKKFLFVGDDDFVSVILTLADSKIECKVIDIDEQLLESLDILASKFNLKIETEKVDLRKQKLLKEKFIGFLVNPVYTEEGVKEFIKYGISQLGKEGGIVFLEVGDEALGNRFLFLQKFFAKENLIIKEIIPNKIYYPWNILHREDKVITKRFSSMFDKKIILKSPRLGALLYIFDYIPFKVSRVKFKKPIYSYL